MKLMPLLTGLTLCGCLLSTPCLGQYLYLDANGDGIHTTADVLNPQGATELDVWLHTDRNRDGSPASCVTGDGDLTINSYEFILHMTGGTVSWGTPINHMTAFTVSFGLASDAVDFYLGWGGADILPPGSYRLATVEVTVLSGSPSLVFVPSTPLSGAYLTSFGSQCDGMDQDNTMKLGREWSDVDGTYGAPVNHEPSLTQPNDMEVAEGRAADQAAFAHDPDEDALTFVKEIGPAFMTVTTTSPSTGNIRLQPPPGSRGPYAATISVLDTYGGSASASFQITVGSDQNRAPTLTQPTDMTVVEGLAADQAIFAQDPDGDALTFAKQIGPAFMTVTTTSPSTGNIHLQPPPGSLGQSAATIAVLDAYGGSASASFQITVGTDPNRAPTLTQPADMTVVETQVGSQPLHAVDPDGDPLTYTKVSGPDFMSIPAPGEPSIRLSPPALTAGVYQGVVRASDGLASDQKSFGIVVLSASSPPPIFHGAPTNMLVFAEQGSSQAIAASDPYDSLVFLKDFGPDFMSVTTTNPGPGTATGLIHLTPGSGDVGVSSAQVVVTDGWAGIARSFTIDVRPALVPLLLPVEGSCVAPGGIRTIQVRAIDPDGDPLSLSQEGLPSYGTFTDAGDGTGTIQVAPPVGTPVGFVIVAVTAFDGTFSDAELVTVYVGQCQPTGDTVGGVGGSSGGSGGSGELALADAAGPYQGVIGAPVSFDATGSTNASTFAWDFGDGTTAVGSNPQHVYERAGTFRATLLAANSGHVSRDEATVTVAETYAARAFAPEGHTTLRLRTGKPSYCFSLEPLGGGYGSQQVDPGSITLVLPGAGSIPSIQGKAALTRDRDENGILEIDACFARENLVSLFGTRTGPLSVQIEGDVDTGGRFRAPLDLLVESRGGAISASLSPLPVRTVASLRFATSVAGAVRVRVFDVHGRVVRTLVDEAHAAPGDHEVVFDGRGRSGDLPSGVYWYRIEAEGEAQSGRFVVVR